jgi:LmbE family N-acetylglucosaminyl deacetylase
MLELKLGRRKALRILCLGAHCDDIEIGCGGALLALIKAYRTVNVTWVAFSAAPARERELKASATRFLSGATASRVIAHKFRDGFFPADFAAVKEVFESLKRLPAPDVVFTHHRQDLHQDHRVVGDLTWNTFRDHLVLEYEIPKYDGGLTTPSAYVALSKAQVERKIRTLLECYASQGRKSWFSAETFRGLMRLRGIESGASSGWAEGFHASKFLLT